MIETIPALNENPHKKKFELKKKIALSYAYYWTDNTI